MAVPKRRQSKSRSAIRRAQVMKQPVPNVKPCPRCTAPQLSHRACPSCGYYKDRLVIEPQAEEEETA
jgi:large subunit ribosomal protein L32